MLRREAHRPEEGRALAMFMGGAVVAGAMGAMLAAQHRLALPPTPAAGWVAIALALALLFLVSNLALQFGAARLPANVTAVVMLSEVVFASATAATFGGGRFTASLMWGGGLIVAAAVLAAMRRDGH